MLFGSFFWFGVNRLNYYCFLLSAIGTRWRAVPHGQKNEHTHTHTCTLRKFQVNRCGITQQQSQCCYIITPTLATDKTQLRDQLTCKHHNETTSYLCTCWWSCPGWPWWTRSCHNFWAQKSQKTMKKVALFLLLFPFFFSCPFIIAWRRCLLSYLSSAAKLVHE